jgi:DnaJ-class molecular chaperone
MKDRQPEQNKASCPGCGGRGWFEWPPNSKVPKRWAPTAACAMCQGTGKIPSHWLDAGRSGR